MSYGYIIQLDLTSAPVNAPNRCLRRTFLVLVVARIITLNEAADPPGLIQEGGATTRDPSRGTTTSRRRGGWLEKSSYQS
jgi:hypothetical protein